jgi:hypothetical protein
MTTASGAPRRYTLTEEDTAAASWLAQIRIRTFPVSLILQAILAAALIGLMLYGGFSWTLTFILTLLPVAIIVSMWLAAWAARRNYRNSKTLHAELEVGWDETGFFGRSTHGESRIAWADFFGWMDGKRMLLLYLQPSVYFVLPERILSPEEKAGIIGHLTAASVKSLPRLRKWRRK